MYNVLLKVKTQHFYTMSGVITPCVRDFNTIVQSCNTSTTMFNYHVCNYNMKKTPKEAWKTFLECSEIWMIYDMHMYNQWMQSNSELSTIVSEISTLSPIHWTEIKSFLILTCWKGFWLEPPSVLHWTPEAEGLWKIIPRCPGRPPSCWFMLNMT